ncbi:hypothetical protein [uncultured Corynebacterium sp.]|uniref:hypothetical protein n=1 Tax=uncultured Corynebacterium sp. TaxID=159447 RepID=UPI00259B2E43|nr:hypothetical protein [uncultured Corynebacterium sp.]
MVTLLFLLALAALLGAVALFVSDARERSAETGNTDSAATTAAPAEKDEARTDTPAEKPVKSRAPGKRARRAWARERGFNFESADELLASEWSRGAAAGGASARNVATGNAYGHDVHVADLGDSVVVAMGTGAETRAVVDFRREGLAAETSDDLVELDSYSGFRCFATQAGAGRRFVDSRVLTALEQLPTSVQAVWFEGAWAIAELTRESGPGDWDAALAPLALLADAARTLPPVEDVPLTLPYPTRTIPGEQPAALPGADPEPVMQRPEDPVALPTRTTGGTRGEVEDHDLGGDDVKAIAGDERRVVDLTRVRRVQGPSSIFDDKE